MFWRKKNENKPEKQAALHGKNLGWFGKQLEENIKSLHEGDRSRIP